MFTGPSLQRVFAHYFVHPNGQISIYRHQSELDKKTKTNQLLHPSNFTRHNLYLKYCFNTRVFTYLGECNVCTVSVTTPWRLAYLTILPIKLFLTR